MDREALRAQTVDLLNRLRLDTSVSPALWELLEVLTQRLDRIEMGTFLESEAPTKPERRGSGDKFTAAKVEEILKEGRDKVDP